MAKRDTPLDYITDIVAWLLGSWAGVMLHLTWFGVWLYFNFSLDLLTLSVSLEAIFIGIFLLMASNKAEAARDAKEARERTLDRTTLRTDVNIDKLELDKLDIMRQEIQSLKSHLERIEKKLYNRKKTKV